jgi:transcriptional regulator with XRE-family HTH domain
MTIQEQFGLTLRNYRLSLGLSQEQLSFKADLHRTYVASVERGERNVSLINIIALCKAINVKPSVFFKNLDNLQIS